jgi:hypothetical protein
MVLVKEKNEKEIKAVKRGQAHQIPPMQVALDLVDLPRAIKIAEEAVKGILSVSGDIAAAWVEGRLFNNNAQASAAISFSTDSGLSWRRAWASAEGLFDVYLTKRQFCKKIKPWGLCPSLPELPE